MITSGRQLAGAAVVVLLAAACGSGGDVATGASGSDPPGIECPALRRGRGDVPRDARVAGYTDADLDELVEQRDAFDLCDVPAHHLFDDPRSIDLYEEHGIVLLPEEEQYWLDYQARYRPAREAVEVMRGQDGFLKARSNVRAGTITVWVTSDSLERQRAVAVRLGAEEGLRLETVRYDLSEMETYRDELLTSLPPALADSIIEVDIEPDRLVVFVESEDVDRAGSALESRSNLVGEGVDVEVRPGEKNTGTGDLCPSRYWTALDRNPTERDEEYWQAQLSIRMQGGQSIEQAWGSIVSVITATPEATTRDTRACQLQ